jgi:cytochrome c biogenesis protein CcmG/thiol:disulfide interchange protein DsbE
VGSREIRTGQVPASQARSLTPHAGRRRSPVRLIPVAILVVGVTVLAALLLRPAGGGGGAASGNGGQPGQVAPLFESTDLSGKPVRLADYRGHRVVLNFWASWCVPCRTEFPVLKRLLVSHPDVVVLGVVFDDSDGPARAFLQSEGATWPGVRDPRGQVAGAYQVRAKPGIPVSILIDASGRVRDRRFGPLTDDAAGSAFIGS